MKIKKEGIFVNFNTENVIKNLKEKLNIFNELKDYDKNRLNIKEIESFNPNCEYEGIKAITFDGLNRGDSKTKTFAYIGFPQKDLCKENEKVPAMVLVHGGAGYPFLRWVKEWNDRGFAAIAVSTVGVFPERCGAGDKEGAIDKDWSHILKGVFEEEGYVSTPDNDDMIIRETQNISDMWMYHAVSQVLLAGNVIGTYDVVDKNRIGAVGISWGSVILSIALGYNNNFSFAINVYGSGYLTQSLSFMRYKFILPVVQDLFLAEKKFENVKIPVMWICMNNDTAFSANSNSLSFRDTFKNNKNTVLSIKEGWIHGHSCCWDDINYPCGEIYEYAKSNVFSNVFPKLLSYADKINEKGEIWAEFLAPKNAKIKGTLFYMTEDYEYSIGADITKSHLANEWKKLDAEINNNRISANVPVDSKICYLEIKIITSDKELVITSPMYY